MRNSVHYVPKKLRLNRLSLFLASARLGLWPSIFLSSIAFGHLLHYSTKASLMVAFALCMVASMGFLFNDICDSSIDRTNNLRRWSVEGPFDITLFGLFTGCVLLTIFYFYYFLSNMMISSIVITTLVVLAYSVFLKKILLLGNLIAAGLSLTPGILIFLDVSQAGLLPKDTEGLVSAIALIIAAFLFLVAREVRFDEFDRIGDAAGNRITLPQIFGTAALRTFHTILGAAALAMLATAFLVNARYTMGVNATLSIAVTAFAGTIMLLAYNSKSKTFFYKTTRLLLLIIPTSIVLAF